MRPFSAQNKNGGGQDLTVWQPSYSPLAAFETRYCAEKTRKFFHSFGRIFEDFSIGNADDDTAIIADEDSAVPIEKSSKILPKL